MEILNCTFQILGLSSTVKLTKNRVEDADFSQKRIMISLAFTGKSANGSFLPPETIATKNQTIVNYENITYRKIDPDT